jgi:hypothetical protein
MNTQREERAPARAPSMRYPEQALAELKLEDPSTPVTVYMIRRLVAADTIPSIQMGRRRLLNYDSPLEYLAHPVPEETEQQRGGIRKIGV